MPEPAPAPVIVACAAPPPVTTWFDLATGLVDLADKVAALVAAALGTMFPHGEHLLFSTDGGANLRFVEIRDRAWRTVHRFADHELLPELPAALLAEFGEYGPLTIGELEELLSEALDFGAVPDGLEPVGSSNVELLRLRKPRAL